MSSTEPLVGTTPARDRVAADTMRAERGTDFASFVLLLESSLGLDLSLAEPASSLRDDLGFDSLAMAELLVIFSDDGIVLPDELIPELRTLGDLHHYFTVYRGHRAPRPPS